MHRYNVYFIKEIMCNIVFMKRINHEKQSPRCEIWSFPDNFATCTSERFRVLMGKVYFIFNHAYIVSNRLEDCEPLFCGNSDQFILCEDHIHVYSR
jgi:hypothetical protein